MKMKILDFGLKKAPVRAHYNDAGMDVFIQEDTFIENGKTRAIPLGFGVIIPDGAAGWIMPKSSLASNGVFCQMTPIDSGYRGEIHAVVTNLSGKDLHLTKGVKIGQLVCMNILLPELVVGFGPERGTGAFGSTGE